MLCLKYRHDDTWWIDLGNKILFRKQHVNFKAVSVSLLFFVKFLLKMIDDLIEP